MPLTEGMDETTANSSLTLSAGIPIPDNLSKASLASVFKLLRYPQVISSCLYFKIEAPCQEMLSLQSDICLQASHPQRAFFPETPTHAHSIPWVIITIALGYQERLKPKGKEKKKKANKKQRKECVTIKNHWEKNSQLLNI